MSVPKALSCENERAEGTFLRGGTLARALQGFAGSGYSEGGQNGHGGRCNFAVRIVHNWWGNSTWLDECLTNNITSHLS